MDDNLVEEIQALFLEYGYMWNIGGKLLVPTTDDIKKVLDTAAGRLYGSSVGSNIVVGHLVIEKVEHGFDVYVHIGEFK